MFFICFSNANSMERKKTTGQGKSCTRGIGKEYRVSLEMLLYITNSFGSKSKYVSEMLNWLTIALVGQVAHVIVYGYVRYFSRILLFSPFFH